MWGLQTALLLLGAAALGAGQGTGLRTTGQIVMQTKVEQRSVNDTHTFLVSKAMEFFIKFDVPESMAAEFEKDPERHIFQVRYERNGSYSSTAHLTGERQQPACGGELPGGPDHPAVQADEELQATGGGAEGRPDGLLLHGEVHRLLPRGGHRLQLHRPGQHLHHQQHSGRGQCSGHPFELSLSVSFPQVNIRVLIKGNQIDWAEGKNER